VGAEERREEDRRVQELTRVNAELAAEIRNLALGRAAEPRSLLLGATRRVARETEATAALEAQTAELESLRRHNEELLDLGEKQVREIEALRAGPLGLLRRTKARLLRRRS
jgi:hypothetical protein